MSTARSIEATYVDTGRVQMLPRGGARNVKMDGDMRNHLENIIDGNPLLTLRQMKESLQHNLPDKPVVSISSVARAVDGMLLTLKMAEDVPDARNAPRVLDQRVEYAEWFLERGVVGNCVFIDETGYNVWTRRTRGRAPRGIPARRVVHGQRGRNCNVTFAVSPAIGLVHHHIAFETVTRESFETSSLKPLPNATCCSPTMTPSTSSMTTPDLMSVPSCPTEPTQSFRRSYSLPTPHS